MILSWRKLGEPHVLDIVLTSLHNKEEWTKSRPVVSLITNTERIYHSCRWLRVRPDFADLRSCPI